MSINLLIVHPSGRNFGSGRYLQTLSEYIFSRGGNVLVVCEGKCPKKDGLVPYSKIKFEGILLHPRLLKKCKKFKPDLILQVGVRTKPIRAALEIQHVSRAPIIIQAEDDEYEPFLKHSPYKQVKVLEDSNKEHFSFKDWLKFLVQINYSSFFLTLLNPDEYRWVDPIFRLIHYKNAIMFGCIWRPMEARLSGWFGKETFLLPPVINAKDYDCYLTPIVSRDDFLEKYKIDPRSFVIFISGTIYAYSKEYFVFLEALKMTSGRMDKKITLVVTGRNKALTDDETTRMINGDFEYINMNSPEEEEYNLMIRYASIVAAPGFNDTFNKYRLSSRLVKALILGRPIFTFQTGFGESLQNFNFAYLTKGNEAKEWSSVIEKSINSENLDFSYEAQAFAKENFDIEVIGNGILDVFRKIIDQHGKYRSNLTKKIIYRFLKWISKIKLKKEKKDSSK